MCAACAMAETAAAPEDVMVTVNGEAITRAEYDALAGKLAEALAKIEMIMHGQPQQAEQTERPQRMRRGLREEGVNDG